MKYCSAFCVFNYILPNLILDWKVTWFTLELYLSGTVNSKLYQSKEFNQIDVLKKENLSIWHLLSVESAFDSVFYYFISIQFSSKAFETIFITLTAEMKFL